MLHKPQEVDIVECHYLLKYFSTAKLKVCSTLLLLPTNTFFHSNGNVWVFKIFVHNFTLYRKGAHKILWFEANKWQDIC
jgi:hypothetical protein